MYDPARRPDAERPLRARCRRGRTYTYPDGGVFTGTWEFRERNGRGTLKYPDGRVYVGDFKGGLRSGKGVMTWPNGRKYEGDFLRGERTGKGTMTYPDGRVYTGDFVKGELTGRGVMTTPGKEGVRRQIRQRGICGPVSLRARPRAKGGTREIHIGSAVGFAISHEWHLRGP